MNAYKPLLSFSSLTITRKDMAVITDGHLVVYPGETICLRGANGSGKTTLAEFLAGVTQTIDVTGSVIFQDKNLVALTPEERARQGLYVALQQVPEFDGVSAENFLYEVARVHRREFKTYEQVKDHLTSLCVLVGLPYTHLARPLFKGFSGGERKRLQLIELLLIEPSLAVLDEIDAGLDSEGIELFIKILQDLRARNPERAFLVITHNRQLQERLRPDRCYEIEATHVREVKP